MSDRPLRFVHSGDFHLERPLHGLAEVPESLRAACLEAPYIAARRVFDAVLSEEVDFLVLAGDLLDCAGTGPRGPLFLVEQFGRLQEKNVPVYWAGGRVDPPGTWPAGIPLPDNVHLFADQPETLLFEKDGQPLAELIGASLDRRRALRPAMIRPRAPEALCVAVVPRSLDGEGLTDGSVHYWALGGRHRRKTLDDVNTQAHYPGSPQGRKPAETGAHGCTLVELNRAGHAQLRFLPTDVVRWRRESLAMQPETTISQLQQLFRERIESLPCTLLDGVIVQWLVTGQGPLLGQLQRGSLAEDLAAWLRTQYGAADRPVWTSAVTVDSAMECDGDTIHQDSLLGEYLRTVHQFQDEPERSLQMKSLIADGEIAGAVEDAAEWHNPRRRRRIIADAAALGANLLSAPHFELSEGERG